MRIKHDKILSKDVWVKRPWVAFLLFILLNAIQLTWILLKSGMYKNKNGVGICCFCYIHLFMFLQTAETSSPCEEPDLPHPPLRTFFGTVSTMVMCQQCDSAPHRTEEMHRHSGLCFHWTWAKRTPGLELLPYHEDKSMENGPHMEREHSWETERE